MNASYTLATLAAIIAGVHISRGAIDEITSHQKGQEDINNCAFSPDNFLSVTACLRTPGVIIARGLKNTLKP